jgi:hypothetical protein
MSPILSAFISGYKSSNDLQVMQPALDHPSEFLSKKLVFVSKKGLLVLVVNFARLDG